MLSQRLVSALIIVGITFSILFLGPAWAFAGLIAVFMALALNELFLMIDKSKQIGVNRKLGLILGVLVAVATYFDCKTPNEWFFIFVPAVCLIIFIIQFTKRDNSAVLSISVILFGLVYVSWFLSFFIRLRIVPVRPELSQPLLILYLILVTKSTDIGAYFVGSKLGRHKLIPRISPNKTVEGLLGGLLFSVAASLLYIKFLPSFSLTHLLILGFVLGILSQVGDLSESLIKRDCQTKDSGTTLPGLGGILDAIDSLLFTAPVFYFYVKVLH